MIESGKNYDIISERIAVLKNAIKQAGDQGRLNIHDSCENLIKTLLNLTFGYKLSNLNEKQKNFPGLDLGERNKIAYQVTSEKTSEKIDETLIKVIRFKHYNTFPSINIFILSGKQGSYTIKTPTTGLFDFLVDINVIDFDDWLAKIKYSSPEIIKSVLDFLNLELPDTIQILKGNASVAQTNVFLIDIEKGLKQSNLSYYLHWSCHLRIHGQTYSAPAIYNAFEELMSKGLAAKNLLQIYNKAFYIGADAKAVKFERKLASDGAINSFKEALLSIEGNSVRLEQAYYKSSEHFLTNLNEEVSSILALLFMCYILNKRNNFQVQLDLDFSNNGKLNFSTQNSIYSVDHHMSNYILNPSPLAFSKMVYDISNETIIDLMQDLIHGFVLEHVHFGSNEPFLNIFKEEQMLALTHIKNLIFPPDF